MSTPKDPSRYTEEQLKWDALYQHCANSDPNFELLLPHALQRLCSPKVSEKFLVTWVGNIRQILISTPPKVDPFNSRVITSYGETELDQRLIAQCLATGLIRTMIDVSVLKAQERNPASYMAIQIISYICQSSDEKPNEIVCRELVSRDGFDVLLRALANSPKFVQRGAASECLERVLSNSYLAEELTIAQITELLTTVTAYNLLDHEHVVRDLKKPENTYMAESIRYTEGTGKGGYGEVRTLAKHIQIAPVWLANTQEDGIMACIDALCRRKYVTRKDCLGMIQQKPEILDKLLLIASQDRSTHFPERTSDGTAIMVLCFLMMLPPDYAVPGDQNAQSEFDNAIYCNEILFKRPKALQMLIRSRNKAVCEEPLATDLIIRKQWRERGDYDMVKHSLPKLAPNAGKLAICSLRLLKNFTLIPDIPPTVFLALLPIAYVASLKVPTESELEAETLGTRAMMKYFREQRHIHEIRLRPARRSAVDVPVLDEIQFFVQPETMIGPALLFRILRRLSAAGYTLDKLRRLKQIPPDTPVLDNSPTSLIHIHQIVEPRIIGKLIRMSVHRRIPQRREMGSKLLEREPDLARVTYLSAAQLAQAVVYFGMHLPNANAEGVAENVDSIRQAYQEVVFCLGNACEAYARMKNWGMATAIAEHVVGLCNSFPPEDAEAIGWDLKSSLQKNRRRLERVTKEFTSRI